MGYIPDEVIDEVLQKIDIVHVISEYVNLKRKGKYYFGICPFHQENTPSFSVTPDKQIFYCFGCHVGGNVFKFLMLKEGVGFVDAVHLAAQKCGVYIGDYSKKTNLSKSYQKKQRSYYILEKASVFFKKYLVSSQGKRAITYLKQRGIDGQSIQKFEIGYAPGGWDKLTKYLASKHSVAIEEMQDVGLVIKSKTNCYDRFRNRIMMPIYDVSGRVVGFGGRSLDDSMPKYLNTPETSYFNKGKLLYGLHLARSHIKESGCVFVVEGYMDVITCHQFGIKNAVASLGTALTVDQVRILMRYTDEIIIAYDADDAGIKAAIRGLDLIQQLGCRVKVLLMPNKMDPDEYIRKYGKEGWRSLVSSAKDLIEFKLEKLTKGDAVNVEQKMLMIRELIPNLKAVKNLVELEESIKKIASTINVSIEAIKGELYKEKSLDINKKLGNIQDSKVRKNNTDHLMLSLVLSDYDLYMLAKKKMSAELFTSKEYKEIFNLLIETDYELKKKPASMMNCLREDAQRCLSCLLSEEQEQKKRSIKERADILKDCIKTAHSTLKKRKHQELINQLKEAEKAGDFSRVNYLMKELQQLLTMEKGG